MRSAFSLMSVLSLRKKLLKIETYTNKETNYKNKVKVLKHNQ